MEVGECFPRRANHSSTSRSLKNPAHAGFFKERKPFIALMPAN